MKKFLITFLFLITGMAVLTLLMFLSVSGGSSDIPFDVVWSAVFNFDPSDRRHLVVADLRLPRVIASALVGAALSVAGAVMQGTTGNPLADSGLLGLNAGAGFAVALCFAFIPSASYGYIVLASFAGAAFGVFTVYSVASMRKGGASPMRLVLTGAAVTALLAALSQGIALYFSVAQDIMFWTVGGVAGAGWEQVAVLAPCILTALAVAMLISRHITVLSFGEEIAKGLGVNVFTVRLASFLCVTLLAGASVSVVGAVAFVGLIFPHLAKFITGADYRRIIPVSAVLGAVMMVLADFLSRTINPPAETPVGAFAALIGVPFFLYLSRKQKRAV